jgi:hypothetical protein
MVERVYVGERAQRCDLPLNATPGFKPECYLAREPEQSMDKTLPTRLPRRVAPW